MLLELIFILETIAAPALHADRFLPPTPIRVVINHKLVEVTDACGGPDWHQKLRKGHPYKLMENENIARKILPAMFQAAEKLAENRASVMRQAALQQMELLLTHEIQRLQSLAQINKYVRPQEIQLAQNEQAELGQKLQQSRLRLDSLRLIWQGLAETLV
ncbi:MAG: hypothetical protein WCS94_22655 [Verrucomicrobiota bacterium]